MTRLAAMMARYEAEFHRVSAAYMGEIDPTPGAILEALGGSYDETGRYVAGTALSVELVGTNGCRVVVSEAGSGPVARLYNDAPRVV